jgi:hypothetical protein
MGAGTAGAEGLYQFDLDLYPNEASGLLIVENGALLRAHGWDRAFWVVLDEGSVDHCVALVGHRRDAPGGDLEDGWEIERLRASPSFAEEAKKTEDCEALARKDGFVYVFGSHFGSKAGPLEPKRGFVARFREEEVLHAKGDPAAGIQVTRPAFLLHRLLNDAFREHDVPVVPLGESCREAFIAGTIRKGEEKGKRWSRLVREGDWPLNIEGAAFRPDNGNLLVGLRFPTAADGRPLLAEVAGIESLFEPGDANAPEVQGFWTLGAVGRGGSLAGVRDLTFVGDELHAVTGDLDSGGGGSVLLSDYPGGRGTVSTHWRAKLPEEKSAGHLPAEPVREFPGMPRVEGIAGTPDGRFLYVVDEDEGVHLRLTRFLAG